LNGAGNKYIDVKIARRCEDLQHPLVEEHLARQFALLHSQQAEPEELQSLDRIDRMHGSLERKMDIVHVQQQERLLDYAQPIPPRESTLFLEYL
jgi:hypothetical protein